ncbi:MAG TPA: PspC domain-containing protein [Solirubrobacteraceae bacterium]|nr:PspC domain-containing protein [Solirubrobacteraceae bacterium]
MIGGVAAELAERLAVPVGFIRPLLLLASFAQGDLVLAYVLAALLLPRAGRRRPSAVNLIAVTRVGISFGLVWGLVGGGLSLNQGLFDQGPAVWVTQCGVCLAGLVALLATGLPAADRDRRRDRDTVRAAVPLVCLVGLTALGVCLVPGVRWDRALAVDAILAGVAILLPWRGSRPIIVPAAVVAAAAVLVVGAGARLDGGVGNARIAPRTAAAIPPAYRRAVGDLTIDLTALRPAGGVVVVRASVGIGTLVIDVPPDTQISAVEQVGRGELDDPGPEFGLDLRRTAVIAARDPHSGAASALPRLRLRILAAVGIGHLEIDRIGADMFGPL